MYTLTFTKPDGTTRVHQSKHLDVLVGALLTYYLWLPSFKGAITHPNGTILATS